MISGDVRKIPAVEALCAVDGLVLEGGLDRGEATLVIEPARIVAACRLLKERQGFERLSAVTCVDWYPREPRFELVYQLHSIRAKARLRLKSRVGGERPEIESVFSIYRSADWYEREVFDLFGVGFRGHPDLRRILMPQDWQGHPLRKDYPVHGHKYSYQNE